MLFRSCISRLEFGTKYCHESPTLDEDRLHKAIVAALNEYGAIREEVLVGTLELAAMAQCHGGEGGVSLLELKQRLEALTTEQAVLLDKVLENMSDTELNEQLLVLSNEKQSILEQIAQLQQDEEQQALQASRMEELRAWLAQQPAEFTEYEDAVTRMMIEQITVVDAETIRVKIRDIDVVIERKLC